ncbi:MAG: hypothetical protein RLZZ522_212 [Verrucomicrobiota bacterium]
MKLHALLLPLALSAGLSSIYFLPQTGAVAQSAINMTLPKQIGPWQLKSIPPSQAEIDILSKDTQFSKATCLRPRPGEFTLDGEAIPDRVDLSVVLSGYDLNNSIHRPERCMPAQGHAILSSKDIPLTLANGRTLTVRRLRSIQTITNPANRKLDRQFECATYYFFVGTNRIECDHLKRTLADMKDRLIRGIDQRWAYVTVSTWLGEVPWLIEPVSEAEADATLQSLLTGFAEKQINWQQLTR